MVIITAVHNETYSSSQSYFDEANIPKYNLSLTNKMSSGSPPTSETVYGQIVPWSDRSKSDRSTVKSDRSTKKSDRSTIKSVRST